MWKGDGEVWEEVGSSSAPRFSGRIGHTSTVLDGQIYVIGGNTNNSNYNNDIWSSSSGNSFSSVTVPQFESRAYHSSVVYNDYI